MHKLRQAAKSRTVQFALVLSVLAVLQEFVFLLPVTPLLQMFITLAIAVGIVGFRAITNGPLSDK